MNAIPLKAAAAVVDGIVLLDKPTGLSSNAALQMVKRAFAARKAGHTGSLDPLASGMLPICLGEATKVSGALLDARKCYRFTIRLGSRTPSGDCESEIIERRAVPALNPAALDEVLRTFVGVRMQVPPMHSALKHAGARLYELARRGIEVVREPRRIEISELESQALEGEELTLRVLCSKGTYVRTLAEELAAALGTCGHVIALRRLWVEPFETEPLLALEQLDSLAQAQASERQSWLLPVDRALSGWPRVELAAAEVLRLMNGQTVSPPGLGPKSGMTRIYGPDGRFLGMGAWAEGGMLQPRRLLGPN